MQIEFWLRIPGEHQKFLTMEMDAVPREGEYVIVDDNADRVVHSVTYDLRSKSVRVLLK